MIATENQAKIVCGFRQPLQRGAYCRVAKLTISDGTCLNCLANNLKGRHLIRPVDESKKKTQEIKRPPCRLLGAATGATVECPTCSGSVQLKLFACPLHGRCTLVKKVNGIQCCAKCPDHQPIDGTGGA